MTWMFNKPTYGPSKMAQKAKFRPIPVTLKPVDHADIDSREKKAETSHG
jgi:hypothetical protein